MRNSFRALNIILVLIFCLSPVYAFAQSEGAEIEEEVIELLLEQVKILSLEVSKLQVQLNNLLNPNLAYVPLTDTELRSTIRDSVSWFKSAQEESGHFRYEYLPYENSYLPLDNIVRQAGGLYALGEVALHDTNNDLDLKETLQEGIRYFDSLSNRGEWNGYSFRCIGNSKGNEMCQLGATSLALVGLIDTVTRYPLLQETYDELIIDYGHYILSMKKEGAGFRHAYTSGAVPSENESSFSNGEALLGLVRFYMYSPNEETKKVILDSFEYFNSPEVSFDFPLYLWVMAAIKDMHKLWPSEDFVDYVDRYTDWRVSGFAYRKNSNHNMCAYVEGVASAHSVLRGNISESKLQSIEKEINYWLRHSLKLQIGENDEYRILYSESGDAVLGKIENLERAEGGFLTDQDELTQRIDFTQHCMNSYLQQLVDINSSAI